MIATNHHQLRPNRRPGAPRWRRFWSRLVRQWPLAIWAVSAAGAGWLYWGSASAPGYGHIRGMVDGNPVNLSPIETARIAAVHVVEGQQVLAGAPLVEMDTAIIDPGITADLVDTVRIETAFGDTHQDVLQAISQQNSTLADLEANLAACRLDWERDEGELEGLREEHDRRAALLAARLIDSIAANELVPQIRALERAVAQYPTLFASFEQQLGEAKEYQKAMLRWLGLKEGEEVSVAIARRLGESAVHDMLAEARLQNQRYRESYILRAPYSGTISATYFRPGDTVASGITIVRMVEETPRIVRAFLPESMVERMNVGDEVRLRPENRSGVTVMGRVERVTAEVNVRVAVLTDIGREAPLRTRSATIRITGEHSLVAGETVVVELPSRHPVLARVLAWLGRPTPSIGN